MRTYVQTTLGEDATQYTVVYPSMSVAQMDQIDAILADPANNLRTEAQQDEYLRLVCGSNYDAYHTVMYPAFVDIPGSISFSNHDIKNFGVATQPDTIVEEAFKSTLYSVRRDRKRLKLLFTSVEARDRVIDQEVTFKNGTYRIQAPNALSGKAFFDIALELDSPNTPALLRKLVQLQLPIASIGPHSDIQALDGGQRKMHSGMQRVTFTNRRLPSQLLVENRPPTFLQFEGLVYPIYTSNEYGGGRNRSNGPRERRILNLDPPSAQDDPPTKTVNSPASAQSQCMDAKTVNLADSQGSVPATPATPKPSTKRKQVSSPSPKELLAKIPIDEEWEPPVGPPRLSRKNRPGFVAIQHLPPDFTNPQQLELSNRFTALDNDEGPFPLFPEPTVQAYEFSGSGQATRRLLPIPPTDMDTSSDELPPTVSMREITSNPMDLVPFGDGKRLPRQQQSWQHLSLEDFQALLDSAIATAASQQSHPVTPSDALAASVEATVQDCAGLVNADTLQQTIQERRDLLTLWLQSDAPLQRTDVLERMVHLHTVHRGLIEMDPAVKTTSAHRFRQQDLNASHQKNDFMEHLKNFLHQHRDDDEAQVNLLYHQALALFEILLWLIAPCLEKQPILMQCITRHHGRYYPVRKGKVWDTTTLYLLLHSTWGDAILKPFAESLRKFAPFQALQQLARVTQFPVWPLFVTRKLHQSEDVSSDIEDPSTCPPEAIASTELMETPSN